MYVHIYMHTHTYTTRCFYGNLADEKKEVSNGVMSITKGRLCHWRTPCCIRMSCHSLIRCEGNKKENMMIQTCNNSSGEAETGIPRAHCSVSLAKSVSSGERSCLQKYNREWQRKTLVFTDMYRQAETKTSTQEHTDTHMHTHILTRNIQVGSRHRSGWLNDGICLPLEQLALGSWLISGFCNVTHESSLICRWRVWQQGQTIKKWSHLRLAKFGLLINEFNWAYL